MTETVDPALVAAACMNDLSRVRQEELPLSDVAKRGPSFDPRGKNGTAHYSATYKRDLNTKWTASIDDDESRKTEGLHIETARPWAAEVTKRILEDEAAQRPAPSQRMSPMPFPAYPFLQNPAQKIPVSIPPVLFPPIPQDLVQKPAVQASSVPTGPAPKTLGFRKVQIKDTAKDTEFVVGAGTCEMWPGKCESDRFQADFELVLHTDKNEAFMHLSAPGKTVRVHAVTKFETPDIEDGGICTLRGRDNSNTYYLRLSNVDETKKFHRIFRGLQQSVALHREGSESAIIENRGKAAAAAAATTTKTSTPPPPITIPAATTPSVATPTVNTPTPSIAPTEGTLIELDGFQQVENTELPTLQNASGHIIRLVDKVITQFTLKEDIIESVMKGIEDGAIEYWVQHGFMRDYDDDVKENLVAVLRNMAQIKLKMHLRQIGQGKKKEKKMEEQRSELAVVGTISVAEPLGRVRYSPTDMKKLQSNATVPSDWRATKGLPVSAAITTWSSLQEIDAANQSRNDDDTVMSNTDEVQKSVVTLHASSVSGPKSQAPIKGLASSRWVNVTASSRPDPSTSTFGAAGSSSNSGMGVNGYNSNVSAPSTLSTSSGLGKAVHGLSSSRYATKMASFHGQFTGPM